MRQANVDEQQKKRQAGGKASCPKLFPAFGKGNCCWCRNDKYGLERGRGYDCTAISKGRQRVHTDQR